MILHALDEYYRRKCDDPDPAQRLPDFGWGTKEIPFILDIDADGTLVQLCDTRELQGKKNGQRRDHCANLGCFPAMRQCWRHIDPSGQHRARNRTCGGLMVRIFKIW